MRHIADCIREPRGGLCLLRELTAPAGTVVEICSATDPNKLEMHPVVSYVLGGRDLTEWTNRDPFDDVPAELGFVIEVANNRLNVVFKSSVRFRRVLQPVDVVDLEREIWRRYEES